LPSGKRRRLDAPAAQDAILAAAEALLIESGPEALRLTEVAARAGVTHPNVLYHFGNVAELQKRLAQRIATNLADDVAHVLESAPVSETPVYDAVSAVFRVFDEGGYARLIAWLALSQSEPTFEALGEKLALMSAIISLHPSMRGAENELRRKRIVPAIQLIVFSAIGWGLAGRTFNSLFPVADGAPAMPVFTAELMSSALGRPPSETLALARSGTRAPASNSPGALQDDADLADRNQSVPSRSKKKSVVKWLGGRDKGPER
jgi:AcrR family transcriptional regulator